jgi:acyl-coenzyme A synthetase/AMP-(fatty) acid ligase
MPALELNSAAEFNSAAQAIAWHADHTPTRVAIVSDQRQITYRRLARDLARCVQFMRDANVASRMLVGLRLSRRYTHLLIALACELAGAAVTPVLTDDDDIVPHCDVIFTDRSGALTAMAKTTVLAEDWLMRLTPLAGGMLSPGSAPDALRRDIPPDQIVRVLRTSGTTGRPKSMPLSHATRQRRLHRTMNRIASEIMPMPRLLCAYPLYIGLFDVRVLGVLYHGGTVFFASQTDVPRLIAAGAVNYVIFSPFDVDTVLNSGAAPPSGGKLCIEVFGATVALSLRERIRQQLRAEVANKYALNETNTIAVIGDDGIGTLEPDMEIRIVDDLGRDVPPGQPGRIRVRGETVVDGYFNDPDLTQASFIDGWFQTSDMGCQPEPGTLRLLGRADDMLNIGGVKLPPAPIEERLRQLDGVSDAVLLRLRTEHDVGMLLVAIEAAAPDMAALEAKVRPILEPYPISYTLIAALSFPRTITGKPIRHAIEAEFRASLDANAAATDLAAG